MIVTLQDLEQLPTAYLPQAHRSVVTTAGKSSPVRAKGYREDHTGMALQSLKTSATAHFPQAHRLIITATGDDLPIGAKGYRPYQPSMAACVN